MLASCDRRTRVGRRDFTVLTLLSRLGLRAGELAALRLSDIDWRAGELFVRGKGRRQEHLPLPADVGEALAGWLTRDVPAVSACSCSRESARPWASRLAGLGGRAARLQAGGAAGHRRSSFRHTAATEMLRAGGSLTEVGQVLRHRSRDVTSIYAKVDRLALAAVVQPWPGAAA